MDIKMTEFTMMDEINSLKFCEFFFGCKYLNLENIEIINLQEVNFVSKLIDQFMKN